jgi:hypothetical protein
MLMANDLIRKFIRDWLEHPGNAKREDVDFLIVSWLKAQGDFSLVQETAYRWLTDNKKRSEASYIIRHLAKIPTLPIATIKDILCWCRSFCRDNYAIVRLSQLQRNLQNHAVFEEATDTLTLVLPIVLQRATIDALVQNNVTNIFIHLLYNPALDQGTNKAALAALFSQWVKEPRSFAQFRVHPDNKLQQTKAIFQLLIDSLAQGLLDVERDKKGIENFLAWVNSWPPDRKAKIKPGLERLVKQERFKALAHCLDFDH